MSNDLVPGELPERSVPFFILKDPAVLSTEGANPGTPPFATSPIFLGDVVSCSVEHVVYMNSIEVVKDLLGYAHTEVVAPASDHRIHRVDQRGGCRFSRPTTLQTQKHASQSKRVKVQSTTRSVLSRRKPTLVIGAVGTGSVAICRPAAPSAELPQPRPRYHPGSILTRISADPVTVFCRRAIPVLHPLRDVAIHVIQPPGVRGWFLPYRCVLPPAFLLYQAYSPQLMLGLFPKL